MGWGTREEVRDLSVDPWGGPGWVGKPLGSSGTGRVPLPEVRDKSEALWKVQDGSGDPQEVQDRSGDPREVQDGSGDPPGGPGWVEGSLGRPGTDRGTHTEVRDGSGDPQGGRDG